MVFDCPPSNPHSSDLWLERSSAVRKKLPKQKPLKSWPLRPSEKKASSRKTKKAAADVRLRLYWGVFSQNLKRVAVFEFDQKDEALKRSEELSKGGKAPHFVQKVKEEIKVE
ncbi:hypothetical protein [Rhodopirellula europaea]|uniref:hypothetical protein n=1 Tax=Rhodopirellula europaea TaxID=1263866 RepID=UPI001F1F442A|nr:hypothetical protein [Rhodopirellula europaea]